MNQKEAIELTAKVMADQTPLQVTIDIQSAWLLVSAFQLSTRHPGLSRHMRK